MIIKRIEPLQCAKVAGTLYALLGLVIGVIFSLVALGGGLPSQGSIPFFGAVFGVGAIIILPICYGIFGFLFSLLAAAFYNVVARLVGGLELLVE
jgi:hypothetical protein